MSGRIGLKVELIQVFMVVLLTYMNEDDLIKMKALECKGFFSDVQGQPTLLLVPEADVKGQNSILLSLLTDPQFWTCVCGLNMVRNRMILILKSRQDLRHIGFQDIYVHSDNGLLCTIIYFTKSPTDPQN